jgi:YegS/Rv2252/BmrU family lipid kinase
MGRTVLVVNPRSANGKTGRALPGLLERARTILGEDLGVLVTQHPGHATALTVEALGAGADCVVAVGGDGTNNEVVNGFIRPDGTSRRPEARFSFVPMGTGGDLRRTFGLDQDVDKALARARGVGAPVDVGLLEMTGHDGKVVTRAYVNVASAGLSGMVDKMVNATSKALGPLSFAAGSLRGLMAFHPYDMTVTVDGRVVHHGLAALCTAANGRFFGGGMRVSPGSDPSDGLLDVVCLPAWGRAAFVAHAVRLYQGDIRDAPGVTHVQGREVRMESREEVLLDVDGEQPGRLPATFRVLPGAILLCR